MHRIFITGAAGYIGAMLVDQFSKRADVDEIIALDREPIPSLIAKAKKLTYIQASLEHGDWQEKVKEFRPDIIIHTAWAIREVYGDPDVTWEGNIEGSDNLFDFAFSTPSVRKLIHFSSVASYGAFPENSMEHFYTEEEPLRKSNYLYAEEKRIAEEHLQEKYAASDRRVQVSVVRPVAITGPRGRFMRFSFGLQSALSGKLKGQKSLAYDIVSGMVAWVPITPKWLRQYVHEDDVTAILANLAFERYPFVYEEFNLAPPGPVVRGIDMARAVGKRMLPVKPWMVRLAFFFTWHLSRGKIPTGKGSYAGYSYPIAVSGKKVTDRLNYLYSHGSFEAISSTKGHYESYVPDEMRG